MFLLIFGILLVVVFTYWCGIVPNTYYYDRRLYKNAYRRIVENDGDCDRMATDYFEFMKIVTHMKTAYQKDVHEVYFLSYLYNKVYNKITSVCPDILECKPLTYDEVKCDANALLDFQDYYHKNISQYQHEDSVEFHDIQKRNERYKHPCSISVYTDHDSHGYFFDIDNVIRDGKCTREIVSHTETDEHINQSVLE
jgi:hypothetical protein